MRRSLGALNNPMFALKGPKMKHGAMGYETNFPLEHAQKDMRFAQLLGDETGISMSVSSAANGKASRSNRMTWLCYICCCNMSVALSNKSFAILSRIVSCLEWYKSAKGLGFSRADFAAVIESIRASTGRS